MAWIILVLSGVLEAVWAAALDRSEGFSHPAPTVVFLAALGLSMAGLSVAMRSIPLGTAYVVWVGVGAVLTVGYAMATGGETASIAKLVLLTGIVACVVGLKLLH
ncbi:MAG TPA: multidrug efflux SMR transporter [Candidatus Limnocylindrales bacterium]|nr:multidrug efflux SMR transporter [Candidatus Limnocylindrales bacterium]